VRWPKHFFPSIKHRITLQNLQGLIRSFQSNQGSFYCFARNRVYSAYRHWQEQLPNVRPFYAVKCNPDRPLLQQLASLGAGFDCASGRELMEVADASLGPEAFHDRVVYANPCKPIRDLQKAKTLGSPCTVIDSVEEIEKLDSVKWQGTALIRLLVEDKGSQMPFSRKFGLAPHDVDTVAELAAAADIKLKGVSFHVGSGCLDAKQYSLAIQTASEAMKKMIKYGHSPDTIDIGGGFMSDTDTFEKSARAIRCAIGMNSLAMPHVKFIAEPGRFFATGAFDLFVQVIGKKPGTDGWRYTIDESLYGQFSCIPFDHKQPMWLRVPMSAKEKERKRTKGILFGRTCDSLDLIAVAADMEELEVGDWLWFPYMGAYSSVTASEFNGFPKPPTHGIEQMLSLPSPNELHGVAWPKGIQTVTAVAAPPS
jgi:ornithine decarboxylase